MLIAGGLFLLWKAVKEIHHVVELKNEHAGGRAATAFSAAIVQIVLLDMVFSLNSVITAVGLTPNLLIIAFAVIASFAVILAYAKAIGDFITRRPALKILALPADGFRAGRRTSADAARCQPQALRRRTLSVPRKTG